ncbi:beta-N-acetylhexosaminidase [Pseudoalteromonas sp. A25]|uniref:beta-N-acetylhexosaminidase n=1 Tax=Pseudoalteromonas sp. A25 TaxID=116092 RepID=UPI0012A0ACF0|nr:beta-N-acetylhexosaminidase [Pseudoalteromonas sp. A25]BBN81195.1 beta-N-acetylhexosaminidase [Pseudoalteromonas sp. A25]
MRNVLPKRINLKCLTLMVAMLFSASVFSQLALMPLPQSIEQEEGTIQLTRSISVSVVGFNTHRSQFQLDRLMSHFSRLTGKKISWALSSEKHANLTIVVDDAEQSLRVPQFAENERYQLKINNNGIAIHAATVFGAQHALATLSQLAYVDKRNQLTLPHINIEDSPRFAWRGLLLDSARHFMPIETVKRQLSGMASAKLNVLHWHLTDDQGWRMQSKIFPKLTSNASDGLFYTQAQVLEVIRYAALLGIRVVPEFGMPGHASAIAVAYPELITLNKDYKMQRHWGVFKPLLNIADPKVYVFIDKLFAEMSAIFPDKYLHIGGDEVEPEQWLKSHDIQKLMADNQLTDGQDLQSYFNARVQKIVTKYDRIMMGWDEILHPRLSKNVVVQSWRGHDSLYSAAKNGYQGILSTGFYIDQPQYTSYHYRNDPQKVLGREAPAEPKYSKSFLVKRLKGSDVKGEMLVFEQYALIKLNDQHHRVAQVKHFFKGAKRHLMATFDSWMGPLTFELDLSRSAGSVMIGNSRYPLEVSELLKAQAVSFSPSLDKAQEALILGAEATIWSELITQDNIDLRIWPRLYAIAERLWSSKETTDIQDMYVRLDKISAYADNMVGLAHHKQQQSGFTHLINKNLSDKEQAETLHLLNTMAQMLEPSHYYTRHHIKFLNNAYHQQAPLNKFVDFLAVESQAIRAIRTSVEKYIAGNKAMLDVIATQFKQWQKTLINKRHLLAKSPLLNDEQLLADKLQQFIFTAEQVLTVCQDQTYQPRLDSQLLGLQNLQDETVIAAIYPLRELYLACTEQKK